jgi:hypothetical protein
MDYLKIIYYRDNESLDIIETVYLYPGELLPVKYRDDMDILMSVYPCPKEEFYNNQTPQS